MKLDFLDSFDFFAGVPDSLLAPVCSYLMDKYGVDGKHHIIAANEGNCVALAAGYHMATGKTPVVYLQNSGLGNIINPVASLLNEKVYGIPCVFLVGWRGEPGVHDEPQHVFQGEITLDLLHDLGIGTYVIDTDTSSEEVKEVLKEWEPALRRNKQVAFVVKKGALEYGKKTEYKNRYTLTREQAIKYIVNETEDDIIVSTTGKASRELFELRESLGEQHERDFLTVGSMGHSSSIALGIALQKPDRRVWVIDGDGAALMHMGAMAVIGASSPENLIHIVINNCAHESVGGMPTVAGKIDLPKIAEACGYSHCVSVDNAESLTEALKKCRQFGKLCFLEIKCAIGARPDLGRPTTTAKDNKEKFMKYLK